MQSPPRGAGQGNPMRQMLLTVLLAVPMAAGATDLHELFYEGYSIVEKTRVAGEFPGCVAGRRIPLENGMVFVCSELNVARGGSTEVVIVEDDYGDVRLTIDEGEYRGTLLREGEAE